MLNWLKKHLYLVILLLSCALIWFVAPIIAIYGNYPFEDTQSRLILVLAVCVVYLAIQLVYSAKKKSKNAKFVDRLANDPRSGDATNAVEKDVISKKFNDALGTLKSKKLAGNKLFVDLPWYLMIGFPGSGKTSCLAKSNLEMPFDKNVSRYRDENESGGTRNLVFNLTSEAVMVDMAGRYTSQDSSHSSDKSGWTHIMSCLKSFRKSLPVNGVVVTLSAEDIMAGDINKLENQAVVLRSRIGEMTALLNQKIPIYFIVTKMDLVLGFTEFFAHSSEQEKAKPYGVLIDSDYAKREPIDRELDQLKAKLEGVTASIRENLIGRVAMEPTNNQSPEIIGFPVQFAKFQSQLTMFFELFYDHSLKDKGGITRGVFFVSNIQKGTPLDNIYHSLNKYMVNEDGLAKFKVRAEVGYFIKSLLKTTVITEQNMVKSFSVRDKIQRVAYQGSSVLAAAAGIALAIGVLFFGAKEISAIEAISAESDSYSARLAGSDANKLMDTTHVLSNLNAIRQRAQDSFPTTNHLIGFSQEEKIADQLQHSYKTVLFDVYNQNLVEFTEAHLRKAVKAQDTAKVYTALKAYLMLTDNPENLVKAEVLEFYNDAISRSHMTVTDPQFKKESMRHVRALLEHYSPDIPADPNLVQAARSKLKGMSKDYRYYLAFLAKYGEVNDYNIVIESTDYMTNPIVMKENASGDTSFAIKGIYTYKGYHNQFLPFINKAVNTGENWVYGERAKSAEKKISFNKKTIQRLKKRYFQEYIKHWDNNFNRIAFQLENVRELASIDQFFYRDSFFVKIMDKAYENAILSVPEHLHKVAIGSFHDSKVNPVAAFYRRAGIKSLTAVEKKYLPLLKFYFNSKPQARFDKLERSMRAFAEQILAVQSSSNGNALALKELQMLVNNKSKTMSAFNNTTWKNTVGIKAVIADVKKYGFALYSGMAEEHLREVWQESYDTCIDAITPKYPFAGRSAESVDIELFATFFAPGGMVDKYLKKHIAPLMTKRNGVRSWKANFGFKSGIFKDIALFKRIQKTYFRPRTKAISVGFKIRPTYLSHLAVGLYIDLGGKTAAYEHGPARHTAFTWPDDNASDFASIRYRPLDGGEEADFTIENDPWATIKIIEKYITSRKSPRQYKAVPKIAKMDAAVDITADSRWNPWNLKGLGRFGCLKL